MYGPLMRAFADQPCILGISGSLNTMSKDCFPLLTTLNSPHEHNIITHLLSRFIYLFSLWLYLAVLDAVGNYVDILYAL